MFKKLLSIIELKKIIQALIRENRKLEEELKKEKERKRENWNLAMSYMEQNDRLMSKNRDLIIKSAEHRMVCQQGLCKDIYKALDKK